GHCPGSSALSQIRGQIHTRRGNLVRLERNRLLGSALALGQPAGDRQNYPRILKRPEAASMERIDKRREKLLPVPRWPTREEAAASRLFSPVRVGPIELNERTWVPAMVPWRATEDGFVTPEVLQWYRRFAQGQPGALV